MIRSHHEKKAIIAAIILSSIGTTPSRAQTFNTIINVPTDTAPSQIDSNTQLNVFDGGEIDRFFNAGLFGQTNVDVEVNVFGGTVGLGFNANHGSQVTISDGSVGHSLQAFGGSQVTIAGGAVAGPITANSGSHVTISGGTVGGSIDALNGSQMTISGGLVGSHFDAFDGSQVTISGGAIGPSFDAKPGSQVTISGGSFRLNGEVITEVASPGQSTVIQDFGGLLTGVFADGTPFAFWVTSVGGGDRFATDSLRLSAVALPAVGPAMITRSTDVIPLGIREGQTLVLDAGSVVSDHFNAGPGSEVVIQHGSAIGDDLEAVGATVTISGGTVGSNFHAFNSSRVEISGGTVGSHFEVFSGGQLTISGGTVDDFFSFRGSEVTISGGKIGRFFNALNGSQVTISGGTIEDGFRVHHGSKATISGGIVEDDFNANPGSEVIITGGKVGHLSNALDESRVIISGGEIGDRFAAHSGSRVTISGGEIGRAFNALGGSTINLVGLSFILDGQDITDQLTPGNLFTVNDRDVVLSGILADGSAFSFDLNTSPDLNGPISFNADFFPLDTTLNLQLAPEPGTVGIILLGMVIMGHTHRRKPGRPGTLPGLR